MVYIDEKKNLYLVLRTYIYNIYIYMYIDTFKYFNDTRFLYAVIKATPNLSYKYAYPNTYIHMKTLSTQLTS